MTLDIEEGEQFTVGSVEVMGLNPDNADTLVIKLKPGDIFGQNLIEEFYKDNQSVIPGDASLWKNTEINQDPKNRTAAIVFDFRGCQEPPSEHRLAQEVRVSGAEGRAGSSPALLAMRAYCNRARLMSLSCNRSRSRPVRDSHAARRTTPPACSARSPPQSDGRPERHGTVRRAHCRTAPGGRPGSPAPGRPRYQAVTVLQEQWFGTPAGRLRDFVPVSCPYGGFR